MNWTEGFLGIIALATLIMALIQIGAIVAATRIARQAQQTLASFQQDMRPLAARLTAVAEEASRTAAMASQQVQKVDRIMTDLSRRIDETASIVQEAIVTPAREGLAIFAAIKAGLSVFRGYKGARDRNGRPLEEEDSLFIG